MYTIHIHLHIYNRTNYLLVNIEGRRSVVRSVLGY